MSQSSVHSLVLFTLLCTILCCTFVDANDDTRGRVQESTHPFLEFNGLIDGTWFIFFIVAVASSRLGTIFVRIGLPVITGM